MIPLDLIAPAPYAALSGDGAAPVALFRFRCVSASQAAERAERGKAHAAKHGFGKRLEIMGDQTVESNLVEVGDD